MATEELDTDALMRQALTAALPADEPPIGLDMADVVRRGRRRYRALRAVPIAAAAAVAALLVAVPLGMGAGEPTPDHLPMGGSTSPALPSSTVDGSASASASAAISAPPTSRASTENGGPTEQDRPTGADGTDVEAPDPDEDTGERGPELRAPAGHSRDQAADALVDNALTRLPPENVAADFGTRSNAKGSGDRYGYGMHVLWREGNRHGYLAMLHRTDGDFPASIYGLPDEPCLTPATRRPEYHCVSITVPEGSTAYSYEIDNGYRVRGVVWDQKDPNGGADMRVTSAFLIPEPGAWTPFRALDTGPRVTSFPLTARQLADLINMPS